MSSTRVAQSISGTSDVTPACGPDMGTLAPLDPVVGPNEHPRPFVGPPCIPSARLHHRSRPSASIRDPLAVYLSLSSWYAATPSLPVVPIPVVGSLGSNPSACAIRGEHDIVYQVIIRYVLYTLSVPSDCPGDRSEQPSVCSLTSPRPSPEVSTPKVVIPPDTRLTTTSAWPCGVPCEYLFCSHSRPITDDHTSDALCTGPLHTYFTHLVLPCRASEG